MPKKYDWQKESIAGLQNFAKQEGTFAVLVIRCGEFKSMLRAGVAGDDEARALIGALRGWSHTVDAAERDGMYPACAYCNGTVKHGYLGGWAMVQPQNEEQAIGLIAAICHECIKQSTDNLIYRFLEVLNEEGFGPAYPLH